MGSLGVVAESPQADPSIDADTSSASETPSIADLRFRVLRCLRAEPITTLMSAAILTKMLIAAKACHIEKAPFMVRDRIRSRELYPRLRRPLRGIEMRPERRRTRYIVWASEPRFSRNPITPWNGFRLQYI